MKEKTGQIFSITKDNPTVAGLISKHGQHLVGSCVPDNYFEYFSYI
ncbi:hypothetical protein IJG72_04270 [bacterium]|nr:hypothetical protein [bacterium]